MEAVHSLARNRRRAVAGVALTAAMLAGATPAQAETTTRLQGGSAVENALAFSQATFADGSAPVALLARDDDFADSLTSGSAQGALQAPLLLTDTQVLSAQTAAELERLGVESIRVMGGNQAISDAVTMDLESRGYEVQRWSGRDRSETSVLLAQELFPSATHVLVARAFGTPQDATQGFVDSIAAGNFSAGTAIPMLLTESQRLNGRVRDYLEDSTVESALIVGGTVAVSQQVTDDLEAIDISDLNVTDETGDSYDFEVRRAAGANRDGTAVALAVELGYPTAEDAPRVLLIDAQETDSWSGGLTAGAQAGNGVATVLSNGSQLFPETVNFLGEGADVALVCGPTVDEAACDAASDLLGNEG